MRYTVISTTLKIDKQRVAKVTMRRQYNVRHLARGNTWGDAPHTELSCRGVNSSKVFMSSGGASDLTEGSDLLAGSCRSVPLPRVLSVPVCWCSKKGGWGMAPPSPSWCCSLGWGSSWGTEPPSPRSAHDSTLATYPYCAPTRNQVN